MTIVTPQTDQRQALISEIDTALSKTQSRLPWVMAGEVAQQRRVLKRVRDYLASTLDRPETKGQLPPAGTTGPSRRRQSLLGAPLPEETWPTPSPAVAAGNEQQLIQAVVADLRSSILTPLQGEIAALQHQREQMRQELQYLDQQRRNSVVSGQSQKMMSEFLQTLIDRCAESLTQQVAQNLAQLQVDLLQYPTSEPHDPILAPDPSSEASLLTPQERLDQLKALQAQSDKLLKTLDASINVVFETLQRNLQSYSESMGQGIEQMYSLGQQGEVMFSALINRLASQLGREASSYLQSRAEEATEVAIDNASPGKSLVSSGIGERSPQPPIPPISQPEAVGEFPPVDPPQEATAAEISLEAQEDIASKFFNELEELEADSEGGENLEWEPEDQEPEEMETVTDASTSDSTSEEITPVLEEDEFYDALFGSDQFPVEPETVAVSDLIEAWQAPSAVAELEEMSSGEFSEELAMSSPETPLLDQELGEGVESWESDLFQGLEAIEEPQPGGEEPLVLAPPSASSGIESTLFEGVPPLEENPVSLETFMELFGEEESTELEPELNLIVSAPEETGEEDYIPASADEILLLTEDRVEEMGPSQLNLNGPVLEQLSQDLFSLEEGESAWSGSKLQEEEEVGREAEAGDRDDLLSMSSSVDRSSPAVPEAAENFLNEILSPPTHPTGAFTLDTLFEEFEGQEPEQGEEFKESALLNLPESLTIDTVMDNSPPLTVENVFEEVVDPQPSPTDLSGGTPSQGTATLENMFEDFLRTETSD